MPIQIPQLDDRDFEQLFAEAKARIPVHTKEWTNFNESDPGITIVQLFAFMTENLLYRSNRIPEANRLKFLKLLGIGLQPASAAQGLVTFRNDRGPITAWPLDAGAADLRAGKIAFRMRTGLCILPVTAAAYYKKPRLDFTSAPPLHYQLLYQSLLEGPNDQLQFYQSVQLDPPEIGKPLPTVDLVSDTIDRSLWVALVGPPNVPVSTVRAAIAGQTLTLGIYPAPYAAQQSAGRVLTPVEAKPVVTGDPGLIFEVAAPDLDPTGQFGVGPGKYVRPNVEYAENVLDTPGIVQITLPEYNKLVLWDFDPEEDGTDDYPPFVENKDLAKRIATWVRIRVRDEQAVAQSNGSTPQGTSTGRIQQQAQLTWVGVNAARVIQAVPVPQERLGVGTGAPDQVYKVANTPVIVDTVQTAEDLVPTSTFVLEIQNVDGGWDTWLMTDDLYAAGPTDKVYTLDKESGLISFGSGLKGMRPPLGAVLRVSYEYGGGLDGNVAIGAINKSPSLPGGFKVENPVTLWNASAGETTADGEHNIPRYLKHRDRLVTASDFHDITLRTPNVDIGRVEVLSLFNPLKCDANNPFQSWPGVVTVMVIPKFDQRQPEAPLPDRLFLDAVCTWLDPRRLITTEIYVRGPVYVPVWVSIGIVTMPGQLRELVQKNVQAAIHEYLSPLFGGPPVPTAAALLDMDIPDPVATPKDPCKLPGTGWPLWTDLRVQDLEAVATRVVGVRYVDSIKLGVRMIAPGTIPLTDADQVPTGAIIADVSQVSITGLQLPRLAGISVKEGPADDLAVLLGQQPVPQGLRNQKPVPVLPPTC